ncbi:hypothetical protein FOZ61_004223 [Perkinsus olseni]|uniref:Uncharacterized protein n=1 Tax=Perkinsus olseni TaxID=32597 RepID=A0A7J6KKK6_PEROL|nr:hypothetical protein FOZ61_004223 [Perkinsus olseni]KAF4649147.1 hypothetical protein FOL46_002080 [Perkinsus olseni]
MMTSDEDIDTWMTMLSRVECLWHNGYPARRRGVNAQPVYVDNYFGLLLQDNESAPGDSEVYYLDPVHGGSYIPPKVLEIVRQLYPRYTTVTAVPCQQENAEEQNCGLLVLAWATEAALNTPRDGLSSIWYFVSTTKRDYVVMQLAA